MGCGGSTPQLTETNQIMCANGPLCRGTRVQTQWLREEGGDGRWYAGVVVALYPGGARATVEYDDGELWTGSLGRVYTLRGDEDEDEEAAQGVPMAQGSAVRGVPMAVGRRV